MDVDGGRLGGCDGKRARRRREPPGRGDREDRNDDQGLDDDGPRVRFV